MRPGFAHSSITARAPKSIGDSVRRLGPSVEIWLCSALLSVPIPPPSLPSRRTPEGAGFFPFLLSFLHGLVGSFAHSFIRSFLRLFIHSFVHSFESSPLR